MTAPRYPTRAAWHAATRAKILRAGRTPIPAAFDLAGNCRICGECGRCPGWHYHGEPGAVLKIELPDQLPLFGARP